MATHEGARAVHATLTAATVDTVTLTHGWQGVRITNRTGTGALWVRFDGTDPVEAADDNFVIIDSKVFDAPVATAGAVILKIISADALDYSVEAVEVR